MSAAARERLQRWGYTVECVREGGRVWVHPETGSPADPGESTDELKRETHPAVWHVEGFGVAMYVADGDADAWGSLADAKRHESAAAQLDERGQ